MRELIYDVGGGVPRRTRAEGGDPRRLVDVGAHRRRHRREDGLHVARRGRLVDRLGGRDRHRRPLLHGAARHPRLAVLRARVVREVHALPCRHEVGHADPREDRGRPRGAGGSRPAALGLRPDHGQVPVPARRLGRDRRAQLRRPVPRRVPGAHRSRPLSVRRRVVARRDPRAVRTARQPTATRRPMSELVSIDGRRPPGRGPEGDGSRRGGTGRGSRDPGVLLRAAARPARGGVPYVPRRDRGHARSSRPAARSPLPRGW